jgi:DnaK suppressor protein
MFNAMFRVKINRRPRISAACALGEKHMDAKGLAKFKKLLLEEKQRILNNSKNALKNELTVSSDDLPDETDLAAVEVNQNLMFKLRDRERLLLSKIDEAMARIEAGSFGTCDECEEEIEPRRLEARPVSTLCIACKEREEHKEKIYA